MSAITVVACASRAILHLLIALHPPAFRRAFGSAVVAESSDDVEAAMANGLSATVRAALDAAATRFADWRPNGRTPSAAPGEPC